ncbi:hypothetical protein [Streptomyces sp. NPDC086838]|uniref:hypothetical protein n=1 Tax=Streptomyces sp. NPDC086838 TaxID=3365762 RepID=UPI0037FE9EA1
MSIARRARKAQLLNSVARRALDVVKVAADIRIISAELVGTTLIVATEEPTDRWAPYSVETFRVPMPDDSDPDYEDGQAPSRWGVLAGWGADDPNAVDGMLAEARVYAAEHPA